MHMMLLYVVNSLLRLLIKIVVCRVINNLKLDKINRNSYDLKIIVYESDNIVNIIDNKFHLDEFGGKGQFVHCEERLKIKS